MGTAMNDVIPFAFDSHAVRVVMHDGEPWFNATDICDALEMGNPSQAIKSHVDTEDLQKLETLTAGGRQNQNHVNESGLYALIFGSTKPEAKRFKRWVTHEVLPTLRKTGSYAMPGAADPLPPSVSHRADHIVAATRSFNGLMRAAATLKLGHLRAVRSATAATLRHTGVDLLAELGVEEHELAPALQAPAAPLSLAERFTAAWLAGELPLPLAACTTGQLYRALQRWAAEQGERGAPAQGVASAQIGRWAGERLTLRTVRLGATRQVVRLWIPAGEGPAGNESISAWAAEAVKAFGVASEDTASPGSVGGMAPTQC